MCNPTAEVSPSSDPESPIEPTTDDGAPPMLHLQAPPEESGSSLYGAIFNFTNCIVGAGAIGLGGAFAESGGLISVATIVFFAFLTKLSLDLVVTMSVENSIESSSSSSSSSNPNGGQRRSASYEELGNLAFGKAGLWIVLVSKFLYSFGCLVAYIIVVKDNFTPALQHFIYGNTGHSASWFNQFLLQDGASNTVTWILGVTVILPLCLLRDMTPLSNLGALSVGAMICIVLIVITVYFEDPDVRREGASTYDNWFQIRPGFVESWGTFVFTFVSQHTVNLTFESLKPGIRTVDTWKKVSSCSITVATIISLTIGTSVYMTFWEYTKSDLFDMYPPMRIIDLAKILLCLTMLLTFPLPFFSCRELLIVYLIRPMCGDSAQGTNNTDLLEPLLEGADDNNGAEVADGGIYDSTSVIFDDSRGNGFCQKLVSCWAVASEGISIMIPGEEKQLSLPFHVGLSVVFWGISTFLAVVSPNLGDILDLVGAATGTGMAFILPGLLSFKLEGYSRLALFIFVVGGAVGVIGTITSLKKLIKDA